jgi:hypothetical protein
MWFSFIGAVCLFVMRFVKRAIYMQVTSAPSLPKHLIIMRPLKIQIVVFLPVVEIIAQEPKSDEVDLKQLYFLTFPAWF